MNVDLNELHILLSEVTDATVLFDDRVVIPGVEMVNDSWYSMTSDPRWPILYSCNDGPVAKIASISAAVRWEVDSNSVIQGIEWKPV